MGRRIIVSSNCQTGGLTAALRLLLPEDTIDPLPWPSATGDARASLVAELKHRDVWVVTAAPSFVEGVLAEVGSTSCRLVTGPELAFDGFHPDLVYATLSDGATIVHGATGPYHSLIALWGWRRGLGVEAIEALFTPEVFARVGYTNRWASAVEGLRVCFAAHGWDHREFLVPMQRRGVFMHTVNHPRIGAIAELGRAFARRLGAERARLAEPIEEVLVDALMTASFVWPVYPGIANELGMRGCFLWKREDQSVMRLREFVAASLAAYAGHDPAAVRVPNPHFHAVTAALDALHGAAHAGASPC